MMRARDFIDLAYYEEAAGRKFADQNKAYAHYASAGQGLNPSPFFYASWYATINDTRSFPTPLDHFAELGQRYLLDPAPFIESVSHLSSHPQARNMAQAVLALTRGEDKSVSPHLAEHFAAQDRIQQEIRSRIQAKVIVRRPSAKRNLVWVQAGPRFRLGNICAGEREWDLLCNWYNPSCLDLTIGEIHILQPGTKVTAIDKVLKNYPDLFAQYERILFLDDDLLFEAGAIDKFFDLAAGCRADMCQPAIVPGTAGVWPDLFQKGGCEARPISQVEIMMPCLTRKALFENMDDFAHGVSGFGVDALLSEHVREKGGSCMVIDAVGARHISPIDDKRGAYYRLMRRLGIVPHLELYKASLQIGGFPRFASPD